MQVLYEIFAGVFTAICLYYYIRQIKIDREEAKVRIKKAAEERERQRKMQFAKEYIQFRKEVHGK